MIRVVEHNEVGAFRERAMPLLMRHECENCVMIGIIERLAQGKAATRSGELVTPMLLTIENENGEVLAVATRTPPHALLFSPIDEAEVAALVEHLHAHGWAGDQFSGIAQSIRQVAQRWQALTGRAYRLHLALRLFRTSRVIDPPPVPGGLRVATEHDVTLLAEWIDAFGGQINEPFTDPVRAAQMVIGEGRLHLWAVDGEARSICAWQGPTPNGVRIGLVYTPPPFRGHGYASNAVAELTRRLLASGRRHCTLFTDKSNPTSNSIYQKIGYEPMADFEHVKFTT